jgi:hypothetical protein
MVELVILIDIVVYFRNPDSGVTASPVLQGKVEIITENGQKNHMLNKISTIYSLEKQFLPLN